MTMQLVLAYAAFWVVLFRALLVRAGIVPSSCARCGLLFERQELGQAICSCAS